MESKIQSRLAFSLLNLLNLKKWEDGERRNLPKEFTNIIPTWDQKYNEK